MISLKAVFSRFTLMTFSSENFPMVPFQYLNLSMKFSNYLITFSNSSMPVYLELRAVGKCVNAINFNFLI